MEIDIFQVDAFTQKLFRGNPAAVCPLRDWIPDETMQLIAQENNLSETAFIVKKNDVFHIRWFTPNNEVNLCGHATLASAFVISTYLEPGKQHIKFHSQQSGKLECIYHEKTNRFRLDFPALIPTKCSPPTGMLESLGIKNAEVFSSEYFLVVVDDQNTVQKLQPDFHKLLHIKELTTGVIVSSQGKDVDFVSRFFAPDLSVPEDPVTGSAHCIMTPYWANKLGKNTLSAIQLSHRRGEIECELVGDRVYLYGYAVPYLTGTLTI
tara:strand:- start:38810 stop:39604 length:795 start_codon:yes stop_codon:yes gene_type:complete